LIRCHEHAEELVRDTVAIAPDVLDVRDFFSGKRALQLKPREARIELAFGEGAYLALVPWIEYWALLTPASPKQFFGAVDYFSIAAGSGLRSSKATRNQDAAISRERISSFETPTPGWGGDASIIETRRQKCPHNEDAG